VHALMHYVKKREKGDGKGETRRIVKGSGLMFDHCRKYEGSRYKFK